MTTQITVTIGRNTAEGELLRAEWEAFQDVTEALIKAHVPSAEFIDKHTGTGNWDGVPEDSAKFTAISEAPHQMFGGEYDNLRAALPELATKYRQDAIALSIGISILVKQDGTSH